MKRQKYVELSENTIFGGKGAAGVAHHIISQIPYHETYIEGFLGLGRIMQLKKPALYNIGIEIDPKRVAVWEAASYPTKDITSQNLAILQSDFLKLNFAKFNKKSTYLFLDPTYPKDSIKGDLKYDFWLTDAQHVRLLKRIRGFNCMVGITTYDNPIYQDLLGDWRKIQFPSQTRKGRAIETMYMNYPEPSPLELHDPTWQECERHQAKNHPDKWRGYVALERRHNNFVRKLKEMNDTEKSLLFHALREEFPYLNIPNPAALAERCEAFRNKGATEPVEKSEVIRIHQN